MDIDQFTFLFGFAAGVLTAGGAGYILGRINVARNDMRSPDRPMNVPTQRTPRQIMIAAAAAFRQCLFWALVFAIFCLVTVLVLSWILFG